MKTTMKYGFLFLLLIFVTGVFVLVLIFLGKSGMERMTQARESREITQILGVSLPETATNIRYFKTDPLLEDPYYEAYIRFDGSEEIYIQLVNDMKMEWANDSKWKNVYWTGQWKAPARYELGWWNPKLESPEMAAIGFYGPGVVVAIFEDGKIFIHRSR